VLKDRSSNSGDYDGRNCTFRTRWQKSAYHTKYLGKYGTDCHQHFSIGRHNVDMSFVVIESTLL